MIVREKESMRLHTSFRAGGEADWYVKPESPEELLRVTKECKKAGVPWYVVGNGSNLLVSDTGYQGVIISMEGFDELNTEGSILTAGSGVPLFRAANTACREGLSGLEFAAGIPGSVGGAAAMNAGAYGSEMKDVIHSLTVLTADGGVRTLMREELSFGYRESSISREGMLVLMAEFALSPGDTGAVREQMEELSRKRREKQPLEYPSAGSTFKRPAGSFAGKLIEEAGLKGLRSGGAMVSEKHAGFVINYENASASDIYRLCREVQKRVKEHAGVELELEVRLLGDFSGADRKEEEG